MRALVLLALALAACGPARNALVDVLPTAPARASCADGAQRCNGLVPERCTVSDDVGRWYPKHQLGADGEPAPCAHRCVVDGEPAASHCAGPEVDGGAR